MQLPKISRLNSMMDRLQIGMGQVGQAPGTLMHVGERKMAKTAVERFDYDEKNFFQEQQVQLTSLKNADSAGTVTWINVAGLHDVALVERIGEAFGIHPLLLEDILNTGQRPKVDAYEGCLYIIAKMLKWEKGAGVEVEQVTAVLGNNFVLTFLEQPSELFDGLKKRLREGNGRLRKLGSDYLTYAILDAIVDHYFYLLEEFGEAVAELEEELLSDPDSDTLQMIHRYRQEILFIRRSVWPLRELLVTLQRGDYPQIQQSTLIFLRDVYEHAIQIIETLETFRDAITTMLDTYLSTVSNRMNEVMKVLTIIATIFIPLTFITSLYGMNIQHMPGLGWRWSYPVLWLVMLVIAGGMLLYFRVKRWL